MNEKLVEFIKRNKKRNQHLYADQLIEGHDYVICPISHERMSMIKDNYIIKILGMTPEDYPKVQRICNKRKENIKRGLHQIDPVSGLTKYEVGQTKARNILKQIDVNGVSGYKKKGQRTRATHLSNIDEFGRNGYSQIATNAILKGNSTKAEKGLILHPKHRGEFYRYKTLVTYLTEKQRKNLTEGYITGLAGKEGAWQIDHIYSIMHGYVNRVSPLIIGHNKNLRMLPWKENLQKHSKSNIELSALIDITGYTVFRSESEFKTIMSFIRADIENNVSANAANLLERLHESTIRN